MRPFRFLLALIASLRGIRFWLLGLVSFIIATVATVFVSGSFLNRLILAASCTIFSVNSAICTPSTPNLRLESDHAMATSTTSTAIQSNYGNYSNWTSQESSSVGKQKNFSDSSLLAFKSFNNEEGHRGITIAALQGSWTSPDGKTLTDATNEKKLLEFQQEAIREIERANRSMDLKEEFLDYQSESGILGGLVENATLISFSNQYDYPWFHFDRETFYQGSDRLID